MWGFWFLASAVCFGTAAYLLKRRSAFKYPPKEVVYTTTAKADAAPAVRPDAPTIDAEYAVTPAASPIVQAPFSREMRNAVKEGSPAAPNAVPPLPEEEKEDSTKFRNIRFFDS